MFLVHSPLQMIEVFGCCPRFDTGPTLFWTACLNCCKLKSKANVLLSVLALHVATFLKSEPGEIRTGGPQRVCLCVLYQKPGLQMLTVSSFLVFHVVVVGKMMSAMLNVAIVYHNGSPAASRG